MSGDASRTHFTSLAMHRVYTNNIHPRRKSNTRRTGGQSVDDGSGGQSASGPAVRLVLRCKSLCNGAMSRTLQIHICTSKSVMLLP